MTKVKKTLWQKKVRCELIMRDMTYKDLAKEVGTKDGYIRQLLCNPYRLMPASNPMRQKINAFLGIVEEEETE